MGDVEQEVLRLRKDLEKVTPSGGEPGDPDRALQLLRALADLKVNLNILTTTRIGMTVNALR